MIHRSIIIKNRLLLSLIVCLCKILVFDFESVCVCVCLFVCLFEFRKVFVSMSACKNAKMSHFNKFMGFAKTVYPKLKGIV